MMNDMKKYNTLSIEDKNELIVKQQIGARNWDERLSFTRDKSSGSCKVKDIKSFVFGGFTSRFWLMRKHINSMQVADLKNLPFFCWQCITISTDARDLNLVIKNETDMKFLVEFLIISLKTVDGIRGSAKQVIKSIHNHKKQKEGIFTKMKHVFCCSVTKD